LHHRFADESFLNCFGRIGMEPYKDSIYAAAA
jgi:hypothetical protein